MKKFNVLLILFITLILSFSVNAQLFISDNSYVFNKGALVYVTTDVELQGDVDVNLVPSNFYLRNEGQLLQGGTVANGSNKGTGQLSVFQDGTSNNYGYNYWCSPVGVAAAAIGNNVFSLNPVIRRATSVTGFDIPNYITSSYNGFTTNAGLTISAAWIYKYTTSSDYSQWSYVGPTGTVNSGLGFTMKGVTGDDNTPGIGEASLNNPIGAGGINDNQRYDFRGKPNDGIISIPVLAPTGGTQYPNSTLTGNPYPSAINLNYFLLENSGYTVNYTTGVYNFIGGPTQLINGNAYYWEHIKPANTHNLTGYVGGYGYYSPNGVTANSPGSYNNPSWNTYNIDGSVNTTFPGAGVPYKRMFCPIGQGFMVQGFVNGNALMKNIYRAFVKEGAGNNSEFERNASTTSSVDGENWQAIVNVANVDYTQFSKADVPQIKIHTVINNQSTKENTLAFNPNTTDGFDVAMDVISYESNPPVDAYFSIAGYSNPFVITTLAFGIDKRIPFTLKAETASIFKVNVGNLINFSASDNIYLFDGQTGIYHDIKNGFFEISLPVGTHSNRFEITFTNTALSVDTNVSNIFNIVQNNINQVILVSNPKSIEVKSVGLFDITGKLIFKKVNLGVKTTYEFSTTGLSDGVYLVKLYDVYGKSISQKIIVEKVK